MEATPDAVATWTRRMQELVDATMVTEGEKVNSYMVGANVAGKAHAPQFFLGDANVYRDELDACAEHGYAGFTLLR